MDETGRYLKYHTHECPGVSVSVIEDSYIFIVMFASTFFRHDIDIRIVSRVVQSFML